MTILPAFISAMISLVGLTDMGDNLQEKVMSGPNDIVAGL
jgi:hypothetical protein